MKPVPHSPREVSLVLTARCNLACKHCSVYGDGEIHGDLALEEWARIIRELSDWKVLKLTLSGGEPLIRDDLPEILDAIAALPVRFSVNTNATLISDGIAQRLAAAAPRLDSVMVGLDGSCAETHDAQRAPGAFHALVEGVERLRRAGVPLGFYCTVTQLNVGELEEIATWGLERGSYVKFNDVIAVGRACANPELGLDAETRREAGARVARLAEAHPGGIQGTLLDMYRFAERVTAGKAPRYPQGSRGCGAMRAKMCVWPDGRVTPCDRLAHETLGNALEQPLPEIWRGEGANKFRGMLAVPIGELEECRGCQHLKVCTGGCPVLPMRAGGSILGRDPGGCLRIWLGEEVVCA